MATQTPFINGTMYDHGTVEVTIAGKRYGLVKSITYTDKMEIGKARGTNAIVRGTSQGIYDAEGSIEFYKGAPGEGGSTDLRAALGNGWMKKYIDSIVVTRGNNDQPVITDVLQKIRMISDEAGSSEGNEVHVDKFSMFVTKIIKAGVDPVDS